MPDLVPQWNSALVCFTASWCLVFLPKIGWCRDTKHHDAVKHTNAEFHWGTKSGKEYLELEPRMTLLSERSYNEEMKKYSIRAKLFAFFLPHLNNRLAVYKW